MTMVIRIKGKEIFDKLEEIVNPGHTAILLIDMQNDFCSRDGHFAKQGKDVSMMEKMIARLERFIEEVRKSGSLIIWTQNTTLSDLKSDSPAWLRLKTKYGEADPHYTMEGSWGQNFVKELTPLAGEIIVKKHRPDAFVGTDLDLILRSNNIKSVIVTGVVSHGCVEATLRHAVYLDYYVIELSDCVAAHNKELHEASLKVMKTMYDVVESDKITQIWKNK